MRNVLHPDLPFVWFQMGKHRHTRTVETTAMVVALLALARIGMQASACVVVLVVGVRRMDG